MSYLKEIFDDIIAKDKDYKEKDYKGKGKYGKIVLKISYHDGVYVCDDLDNETKMRLNK